MIIGDLDTFAFDVGRKEGKDLRRVDVVIGGRYVCCDDRVVFVPQFSFDLERSLKKIQSQVAGQLENILGGRTPEEAHRFIVSTTSEESENFYKPELEEVWPTFRFMNWGPTTDNLTCFLLPLEGKLFITYEFWREEHQKQEEIGQVFVEIVEKSKLIQSLKNTICELTRN